MNNGITYPIRLSVALRADPADLTNGQLAAWLLVSDETISNVRNGGWDARFEKLNNGFRHMPDSTAYAFFASLFAGTRWQVQRCDDVDGDLNGDGRVTPEDSFDGVIAAVNTLGDALDDYKAAAKHGVIGCDDSARLAVKEDRIFDLMRGVRAAREASTASRGPRSVAG